VNGSINAKKKMKQFEKQNNITTAEKRAHMFMWKWFVVFTGTKVLIYNKTQPSFFFFFVDFAGAAPDSP